MALAQEVKVVFQTGLLQKVGRYISPPNPNGPSSCLWKSDSFSMKQRTILMARLREFKTSFFSTTRIATPGAEQTFATAEIHYSAAAEAEAASEESEKGTVTSHGVSGEETDSGVLERSYGEEQADHHKVAESAHDLHVSTKDDDVESLEQTGFDISKVSRPSGDE